MRSIWCLWATGLVITGIAVYLWLEEWARANREALERVLGEKSRGNDLSPAVEEAEAILHQMDYGATNHDRPA